MTTNKKLEYQRKWELLRQRDSSGCMNREDLIQQFRIKNGRDKSRILPRAKVGCHHRSLFTTSDWLINRYEDDDNSGLGCIIDGSVTSSVS